MKSDHGNGVQEAISRADPGDPTGEGRSELLERLRAPEILSPLPPEVQLRVRTEFTFGETFAPIGKVVDRLKAMGVKAAGIVDPGTWGHVQWDKACRAADIIPLFGVQLAVVAELSSEDRPSMWFLALSNEGLRDLYAFASLANRQAERGVARLTFDQVWGMGSGIAKFAGAILDGPFLKSIGAYLDLDPGSPIANRRKAALARELGLRTVAVSDNLFAVAADRQTFEMIGRASKPTPQHILSHKELAINLMLRSQGLFEATDAWQIAEQAAAVKLPVAPIIEVEGDLEKLCREGIVARGMDVGWSEEYEKRLVYELELIRSKKYESYFLMVADMVRYAKTKMLVGPSRGSAAGSLVCYLTRITEIDPIKAELIFERFIDVTRTDLPDIDLDFVDSKRHLIIEYLREKYGERNVAQIGTVATFQPKSALIAVAKRLNIPPWETNEVKDSIFARSSGDARANFALLDTLEQTEPGKKLLAKHPAMALAANIEAHATHSGIHAAGILVCNQPIENFCSVTADGIAQIDKKDAEKLNLLKIDVLGLRTLGVLEDTGVQIDWYNLDFKDQAVWDLVNAKRYAGIFQFEGPALQSVASQMVVGSLDDLGHITALARPGPMASGGVTHYLLRRAGKEAFTVPHPAMLPFVKETYGIVVYQEDVLNICKHLGRMSWPDVTRLRQAMSKSYGKEFFDQYRDKFIVGAAESGIDKNSATAIWEMVNTMGSWCLAADTKIKLSTPGPYKRHFGNGSPTIAELYEWQERKGVIAGLLSEFGAEGCQPQRPTRILKNGKRLCYKYTLRNVYLKSSAVDQLETVTCTADHKFVVNGKWSRIGDARIGDKFSAYLNLKPKHIAQRERVEAGRGHAKTMSGRYLYADEFRELNRGKLCESCREKYPRMEVHHNDFAEGRIRPDDLSWLCPKCHADKHRVRSRYDVGLRKIQYELVNVERVGVVETYDIEMPNAHNFILQNGLLTHNSFNRAHSYSYAVVSYWTAYAKAHHLLEFAAATLRNSRSDESTIGFLRELINEGVPYIPFDPELSEVNWSVKNGKLIGGFLGLKGIGESKAAKVVEERVANGGRLGDKTLAQLAELERTFADVFPTRSRWQGYYDNPQQYGVRPGTKVSRIEDIKGEGEFVYIGRLKGKDLRDHNEDVRVKRRNGKRYTGPTLFLDLDLEDDTAKVLTRIERYDYEKIGKPIWENAQKDTWWLVRGQRKLWGRPDGGFRMIYVDKIMQLHEGSS